MKTFIIAEAGVNHNGSIDMALQLVEVAAHAGADAVKFQTFRAEQLVTASAAKAEYQQRNTGNGSQLEMLKALEMSEEMHYALVKRCAELNIEFMSTAFDAGSLDFLINLGIKRIKIPSGEITNFPLLEHCASKNLPIILSTGMASLEEVEEAIEIIKHQRGHCGFMDSINDRLIVLHCTSNYPAQFTDVNLRAMQTLATKCKLPVGYSDHTNGILVSPLAVAMGACLIEKHFTIDKNLEGPDHQASLDPEELKQMIANIRLAELCLGSSEKQPQLSELPVRDVARRSVTLICDKAAGSFLMKEDLAVLRPGTGIHSRDIKYIIGKELMQDLPAGTTLQWQHLKN